MLIDVAISGDRNVFKKEVEKILKYKDLTTETQRMWNVKARVIPVIMGAMGPFPNLLENTWATYQKTMTLRNYRKQPYWALHTYFGKNKRANAGTRDTGTINNKDRIVATMYPLRTWFVSGIYLYVWIPCIKEMMMMMMMMMMMIMIIIIIIIIIRMLCFSLHLCHFTQGTFSKSLLRLPHTIIVECTNVAWPN